VLMPKATMNKDGDLCSSDDKIGRPWKVLSIGAVRYSEFSEYRPYMELWRAIGLLEPTHHRSAGGRRQRSPFCLRRMGLRH
jgi:hypothetical protein